MADKRPNFNLVCEPREDAAQVKKKLQCTIVNHLLSPLT